MPLIYDPPGNGALRQGEVLEGIWWHRPLWPASEIPEGTAIQVEPVYHPLIVVLHQDCDLERDYEIRVTARSEGREPDYDGGVALPQILCCDAFAENQMKIRAVGVKFERVKANQVERFHCLPEAPLGPDGRERQPGIYLDFRGVFSVFTAAVYQSIEQETVRRRAVIPPIYLHDLTHRAFGYLSRVALP